MRQRARLIIIAFTFAAVAAFIMGAAYQVWREPRDIMARFETAVANAADGYNTCFHRRTPTVRPGGIRRGNPDVLPSTLAYDLSAGPVLVSGRTWPAYWSLSVYQHNSDNIFVINDRELDSDEFAIVLSEDPIEVAESAINVVSPSRTGLVVIRRLATRDSTMDALRANQDLMECGPLEPQNTISGGLGLRAAGLGRRGTDPAKWDVT